MSLFKDIYIYMSVNCMDYDVSPLERINGGTVYLSIVKIQIALISHHIPTLNISFFQVCQRDFHDPSYCTVQYSTLL